jgi:hypothetical protein
MHQPCSIIRIKIDNVPAGANNQFPAVLRLTEFVPPISLLFQIHSFRFFPAFLALNCNFVIA